LTGLFFAWIKTPYGGAKFERSLLEKDMKKVAAVVVSLLAVACGKEHKSMKAEASQTDPGKVACWDYPYNYKTTAGQSGSEISKKFDRYFEACDDETLLDLVSSGRLSEKNIYRLKLNAAEERPVFFDPGKGASTALTLNMSDWHENLIQSVKGNGFIAYTAEKRSIGTDEVELAAINDAAARLVVP
jgi:hypothetical protein